MSQTNTRSNLSGPRSGVPRPGGLADLALELGYAAATLAAMLLAGAAYAMV